MSEIVLCKPCSPAGRVTVLSSANYASVVAIPGDADDYMEHVLERWRAPLVEVSDDILETPEYPSRWKTRYCIDSMLEHAVMHPIRHAFQLDELLKK